MAQLKDTTIDGDLIVNGNVSFNGDLDVPNINNKADKATTLAGYGITDGTTKNEFSNLSNPNLLINGDFKVNQRKNTNYPASTSASYTVDRWLKYKQADLTVNSDGISVVNTSDSETTYIRHVIEDGKKFFNSKLTLSVKYRNVKGDVTAYLNEHISITDNKAIDSNRMYLKNNSTEWEIQNFTWDLSKLSLTKDYLGVVIRLPENASVEIAWVKLEQGSIATPFVPRLYAEELAMCQRYYQPVRLVLPLVNGQPSQVSIPYGMRTAPTVVAPHKWTKNGTGGIDYESNIEVIAYDDRALQINLANSGYTNAYWNFIAATLDAEIY